MHLRDRLPHIVASKKVLNAFLKRKSTFDEAWARVEDSGSTDNYVVRFKKFREWLADRETSIKRELDKKNDETSKRIRYEVRQVKKIVSKLKID